MLETLPQDPVLLRQRLGFAENIIEIYLIKERFNPKLHCDVIHCYVKCQPEIDWLVKQSKVQHLL
jgi:hypothetical protein